MNNICTGCGKLISESYYYCPWCGYSRISEETKESLNLKYEQYKQKKLNHKLNQLEKMREELDALEKELSILVLSTEMHK